MTCRNNRNPAFSLSRSLWALAACVAFLPLPASAIDLSLCNDDGVTEVPDFAEGRDANQCLMVDPGNGTAPIPFQYEQFHKSGLSTSSKDSGDTPPGGAWIDVNRSDLGACPTKTSGQYCSFLFWDMFFDNYHPAGKNDDVITIGNYGMQYLYIKDSVIANGWKCAGKAWSGPGGISCASGETSSAHSDGIQLRGTMVNNGWLVIQDTAIVNSHISLIQGGGQSDGFQPQRTNLLFQGLELGTKQSVGKATQWISDCYARGATDACENNRATMGFTADQLWFVDVHGNAKAGLIGDYKKVVVVNRGCGERGCGGSIEYETDGWPHPINGSPGGPNSCPNGLMPGKCVGSEGTVGACFCYTSLENALNDQVTSTSNLGDCPSPYCPHQAPPFIQYSTAGWANAPSPGTQRPAAPLLLE